MNTVKILDNIGFSTRRNCIIIFSELRTLGFDGAHLSESVVSGFSPLKCSSC
jgi:hypothetical protein